MSPQDPPPAAEATPPLRGLLDGFQGFHKPTDAEWQEAYVSGLIVLDTSALLDAYRLSQSARKEFLELLGRLKDRIFIPHQVAAEFHARRVDAVAERSKELADEKASLLNIAAQASGLVNRVAQRAHGKNVEASEAKNALSKAFGSAETLLNNVIADYDLDADRVALGNDPVLRQLEDILQGRVGSPPTAEQRTTDLQEGARRAEAKLAPGFKDRSKSDNPYGDYLWWAEVVRWAISSRGPVAVITNDVGKGDWTFELRGMRIGAHPQLVQEMMEKTGHRLLLATVSDLLRTAPRMLSRPQISEATLAEAQDLPAAKERTEPVLAPSPAKTDILPSGAGGITLPRAAQMMGLPYAQLEQWVRSGLIKPNATFGGLPWLSFREAVLLKVALALLEGGLPTSKVQSHAKRLRDIESWTGILLSANDRLYLTSDPAEVADTLMSTNGGIAVDLREVAQDVRGVWPAPDVNATGPELLLPDS
ncbi:PIN domain-containing protein [Terrabacter sp. C0L_2]|uniref:PIN domain-containing protein n=1 Tax=Terrabacter sp. C0L_2 TaxID=3108389 RepID=UPI002ED129E1|nr:PIN domain-containing protein [Terrabacter sp. C0L_2]